MFLWGAERFMLKDVEIAGISMRDLRWEVAANHHLNIFLEECIDEGLHSVNCFGHLGVNRGYPIHVPEGIILPEGLSNEVWDDFSFIMEVGTHFWNTCVSMYNEHCEQERKLALERGGYEGSKIKGE